MPPHALPDEGDCCHAASAGSRAPTKGPCLLTPWPIVVPGLASGTAQGTLPWSWYSDPTLPRQERERVFRRGRQYAGPAEHASEALA